MRGLGVGGSVGSVADPVSRRLTNASITTALQLRPATVHCRFRWVLAADLDEGFDIFATDDYPEVRTLPQEKVLVHLQTHGRPPGPWFCGTCIWSPFPLRPLARPPGPGAVASRYSGPTVVPLFFFCLHSRLVSYCMGRVGSRPRFAFCPRGSIAAGCSLPGACHPCVGKHRACLSQPTGQRVPATSRAAHERLPANNSGRTPRPARHGTRRFGPQPCPFAQVP